MVSHDEFGLCPVFFNASTHIRLFCMCLYLQITATSHWTHQYIRKAEVLMKRAQKSRRPVILMDMYYVYCSFNLAVLKSRDLKCLQLSWRVTDTNRVLVGCIVDTSYWVYWGVCHNSKDWHLPNPEKLMDIYMIKSVPGAYFETLRKIQHYAHTVFCKTDVKSNGWLKGLEPEGHKYLVRSMLKYLFHSLKWSLNF